MVAFFSILWTTVSIVFSIDKEQYFSNNIWFAWLVTELTFITYISHLHWKSVWIEIVLCTLINIQVCLWTLIKLAVKCRFLSEEVTQHMRAQNTEFGRYVDLDEPIPSGYRYQPLPSTRLSTDEHDVIQMRYADALGTKLQIWCFLILF